MKTWDHAREWFSYVALAAFPDNLLLGFTFHRVHSIHEARVRNFYFSTTNLYLWSSLLVEGVGVVKLRPR